MSSGAIGQEKDNVIKQTNPRNATFASQLKQLQIEQYRHDNKAHQDILGLPVPRRLAHFTLHFAKYVGSLSTALRDQNAELQVRIVTDSLIIALAAANAMNVDLERKIEPSYPSGSTDVNSLLWSYAEIVGEMAKACEATDHMEDYPSRAVMERNVARLIPLIRDFAGAINLDLTKAVKERWRILEQKSVLCIEDNPERNKLPAFLAA